MLRTGEGAFAVADPLQSLGRQFPLTVRVNRQICENISANFGLVIEYVYGNTMHVRQCPETLSYMYNFVFETSHINDVHCNVMDFYKEAQTCITMPSTNDDLDDVQSVDNEVFHIPLPVMKRCFRLPFRNPKWTMMVIPSCQHRNMLRH